MGWRDTVLKKNKKILSLITIKVESVTESYLELKSLNIWKLNSILPISPEVKTDSKGKLESTLNENGNTAFPIHGLKLTQCLEGNL